MFSVDFLGLFWYPSVLPPTIWPSSALRVVCPDVQRSTVLEGYTCAMSESLQKRVMWQPGEVARRARQHMEATDSADLRADLATARALCDVLVDRFEGDLSIEDGSANVSDALRALDTVGKLARAQHQKASTNAIPAQKVAALLTEMQRVVESYVHDATVRENILTAWRQIVVG